MNKIAEQVLLGSMCGDGTIRHRYKYPVYREVHCIRQEEYLKWKAEVLSELNPRLIYGEGMSNRRDKIFKNIELYTPMNEELLKFHKLFYHGKTGSKHISYKVLKMLNPLGLAIWYMDDGSYFYRGRVVELASCMNDFNIQRVIQRYFKNKFGFICSINKAAGGKFIIKFSVESSDKFLRLIQRYVPKCLKYKLGHLCEENIPKLLEAKKKVAECSKIWSRRNVIRNSVIKKKYYLDNKKHILDRSRDYYNKNRDRILVRQKERKLRLMNND